jgi:hypothetical protein
LYIDTAKKARKRNKIHQRDKWETEKGKRRNSTMTRKSINLHSNSLPREIDKTK